MTKITQNDSVVNLISTGMLTADITACKHLMVHKLAELIADQPTEECTEGQTQVWLIQYPDGDDRRKCGYVLEGDNEDAVGNVLRTLPEGAIVIWYFNYPGCIQLDTYIYTGVGFAHTNHFALSEGEISIGVPAPV